MLVWLYGGLAICWSGYMLVWAFDPKPPETVTVVTPDDADGDEPAGDEEKKAE
ncbi:hypothetical protein HFO49_11190 [Rhizobium leguminosarum]|uniref:hypothetical protein n=1 Tax=Rhizobium leguminosarum TaxID=384 RepID=UPI001C954A26|nr:hypothetical protein [Rhizobium leguminosarum]MBY5588036.1 hypothetical protein [Rhizobium leguminosarum]MBY5600488.1 hypothetical protein [Rhizobium leguminosarum]